jgi:glycosyltransferase involved in cell wall biosynthesis
MHDLKFASVKQAARLSGLSYPFTDYLSGYVKTVETGFLGLFDAIITFSKEDAQQLSDKISEDKLHVAPFAVLDNKFRHLNEEEPVTKLVFIGPDHHYPNLDAIHWYAESIGRLLYEKSGFKLMVVGKWSEANKNIFRKKEFIQFEGFVEDIDKVFENATLLVPLRIGSGIRTKILEAFAMGVPVIATALGCEGLEAQDGKEIMIADDRDQFVASIERIVNDKDFTNNMRRRAQQLATKKYAQSVAYQIRIDIYHKLIS